MRVIVRSKARILLGPLVCRLAAPLSMHKLIYDRSIRHVRLGGPLGLRRGEMRQPLQRHKGAVHVRLHVILPHRLCKQGHVTATDFKYIRLPAMQGIAFGGSQSVE